MIMDSLFGYLDAQSQRVIDWQREMTARPAMGPENKGQGEEAKAAWLTAELERMGNAGIRQHP